LLDPSRATRPGDLPIEEKGPLVDALQEAVEITLHAQAHTASAPLSEDGTLAPSSGFGADAPLNGDLSCGVGRDL